jgi:hypothetical protein
MFGPLERLPFTSVKIALLVLFPPLVLLCAEVAGQHKGFLRLAIALPVSFWLLSLPFGDRLGGHHYMSLLPVLYVAMAAAFAAVNSAPSPHPWRYVLRGGIAAAMVALIATNIVGQQKEFALLERTGGTGLFSDAINTLAADLSRPVVKPLAYFPDWGLLFPVIILTGGNVPSSELVEPTQARKALCRGQDVAIAVIGADWSARIATWQQQFAWDEPRITIYRQRDGIPVFRVATFAGAKDAPPCSSQGR